MDANSAAIHVYRKVAFVEEDRARAGFRRDGAWHDMILIGAWGSANCGG